MAKVKKKFFFILIIISWTCVDIYDELNINNMQEIRFEDFSSPGRREQSGCFHVILNANYQNIIFNTDLERIMFLRTLNDHRKKFNVSIFAIALMHTHVHMLIFCDSLSEFMKRALHDFSMWYNRFRGQKGSIFQSPFSSFIIKCEEIALEKLLYILRNPYVDGLCSDPRFYKWSSYNCYFSKNATISRYVDIDTSLVLKYFKNVRELHNAVIHIPEDKREIFEASSKRVKDDAVIRFVDYILAGKSVTGLKPEEIRIIICKVRKEIPASIRQLSSILRVSKEFVRRTIGLPD